MKIPKRCQLFLFAILIGLAAVLLPYAASASLHGSSCGKTGVCAGGEPVCMNEPGPPRAGR